MIHHTKIDGWFDTQSEQVCAEMVLKYPDGSHFVEVGAYMGRSTCYIGQEIIRKEKKIKFDVIDHFKGSPEHQEFLKDKSLYDIFIENMKKAEILDSINVIQKDSNEAVKDYENNSLDFIYIDADHSYEAVKNDINIWIPKIKTNGTLVGDDYVGVHPGVIKAVDEVLGKGNIRIHGRNWIYEKKD